MGRLWNKLNFDRYNNLYLKHCHVCGKKNY